MNSFSVQMTMAALAYSSSPVITDVNLQVKAGEALALIGSNGSGKTTVLRAILGMVKAISGSVEVLGKAPGRAPRGSIGYVPQISELDKTFPVTVQDVVLMGLYPKISFWQRVGSSGQKKAHESLEKVDLLHCANYKFGTLSGGQQQRVLVARCLAAQPQLLLLDEPFNGLDQPNRDALLRIINEIKASGVSVVVSTHDLTLARDVCEQVALLGQGRQVAFGKREEILVSDLLDKTYGGHDDYVDRLLGADPHNLKAGE